MVINANLLMVRTNLNVFPDLLIGDQNLVQTGPNMVLADTATDAVLNTRFNYARLTTE